MTVASTTNRHTYTGSGITGPYAYSFKVFAATDLAVIVRDPDGLETTLAYPGDYTVTGVGTANGGTVTLTTALAADWTLSLRRVRPLLQGTELRNQGPYFPSTVEDTFDHGIMVAQQLQDGIDRSVRLPASIGPATFDPTLPANLAAGNAIVVNGAGTGLSQSALSAAQLSAWSATQNQHCDVFTSALGQFTAGVTTQLTLSAAPGNALNVWVIRRTSGAIVTLGTDEYTLSGTTLTFTSVIPASTTRVEVRYFATYQVNTALSQNVSYAPLTGAGTDVQARLRSFDARFVSIVASVKDTAYGALGNNAHDDTAAINAAAAAVDAAGGGGLQFPSGTYLISGDLTIPRSVTPVGAGAATTVIRSASQRRCKITGANVGSGDTHVVMGVTFDTVSLDYGTTNSDFGRGCITAFCEFYNSDRALYYGYNCFNTDIIGCRFRANTTHIYFDFATAGSGSGAKMGISHSVVSEATNGIYVNGNTADGHHIYVTDVIFDNISRPIKTVSTGEGVISLKNVSFEAVGYGYADGYFVENDGSNVFIDGFWALSTTETAWFYNKSGNIFIKNGRGSWTDNKFATITGGIIQVDAASIFCGARWWGSGVVPMVTAGSTGGTIVGPSTAYVGLHNAAVGTLTNASPGPLRPSRIEPRDGNERKWEFDVECTAAVAANNNLRIDLENGHSTVRCDLNFPLVVGGAHVTVTHTPGGAFSAECTYAPTTTAGDAVRVSVTTTDSSTLDDERFLALSSVATSGTKSTMTIRNFCETISGPHVTGL